MDNIVKRRLIIALALIGLVLIMIPITFHNTHIKTDNIAIEPIASPAPAKPAVAAIVAQQAQALAATQEFLLKQAPSSVNIDNKP